MSTVSPEQLLPWAVWQQKLLFYLHFTWNYRNHTPCSHPFQLFVTCWQGLKWGWHYRGAAAQGSLTAVGSDGWGRGQIIPAPLLNLSGNICTIPTCRAPCDSGGLCCTSCPRSLCPALLLLPCCILPQGWIPGLCLTWWCVVVSSSRFFIALWVSLRWKALLQSFRTLFRSSVAWGFFCRQGTCHLCSDTSRQGLLNYPHPLKIEIHSPAVFRHIFISGYSELSSSYPSLIITAPNLWFAQAFRKIHFFQTGAVGISVLLSLEMPSCSNAWWWREGYMAHTPSSFFPVICSFPRSIKMHLLLRTDHRRGQREKFRYTLKCRKWQGDRKK